MLVDLAHRDRRLRCKGQRNESNKKEVFDMYNIT